MNWQGGNYVLLVFAIGSDFDIDYNLRVSLHTSEEYVCKKIPIAVDVSIIN